MTRPPDISPLQWRFILETLVSAYTEMDASEEFSQGVIDDMREVLIILGVNIEQVESAHSAD